MLVGKGERALAVGLMEAVLYIFHDLDVVNQVKVRGCESLTAYVTDANKYMLSLL